MHHRPERLGLNLFVEVLEVERAITDLVLVEVRVDVQMPSIDLVSVCVFTDLVLVASASGIERARRWNRSQQHDAVSRRLLLIELTEPARVAVHSSAAATATTTATNPLPGSTTEETRAEEAPANSFARPSTYCGNSTFAATRAAKRGVATATTSATTALA